MRVYLSLSRELGQKVAYSSFDSRAEAMEWLLSLLFLLRRRL